MSESATQDPDVAARIASIRHRIARACDSAGRDPAGVTLVAASKSQPIEKLLAARAAGITTFGENRVQEASAKKPTLPDVDWHLLGPLQSNKVRQAAELFSTYHALDRPKILLAVAEEALRRG